MKILFAGPSLCGEIRQGRLPWAPDIVCRGPAQQGDVARAVIEGAAVIGLVDGRYEDVAAPWHKEILFALARGITVFGSASLGALRAAECASYGMIGIGKIFETYRDGQRIDDADVAQLHGPVELDYVPVTEALVNIEATLDTLMRMGKIGPQARQDFADAARAIFFKDRSIEAVVAEARAAQSADDGFLDLYRRHYVDQKHIDAMALVSAMKAHAGKLSERPRGWVLESPRVWREFLAGLESLTSG